MATVEHECRPEPEPPGTELPPDYTCPECGTKWRAEQMQLGEHVPAEPGLPSVEWIWVPVISAEDED